MDIRKVKKLIELVESSDVAEIEIKAGDEAIRISRFSKHAAPVASTPIATSAPVAAPPPASTESAAAPASRDETKLLRSPMVGTFYASSSPGSPSFVEVGQTVSAGQTVCIIEAMKMLNQIEAPHSGTIAEVLVQNEDSVEYDQPLFVIE
ncbi:MAG: acetyl-CoA carboxylase biotin carboxyl carrier protein [Oceanococcus sp.]